MDLQRISIPNYKFTNWSRTFECKPELYFIPENVEEIREIIFLAKSERKKIRIVGCGNSPSDICCSNDYMINLERFNRIIHVDREKCSVTVQGGIKLTMLNKFLEQNGLALPVLGSISDSTIAGVISVGTHGTGFDTGIIADYVTELRLILPSGDIVCCNKNEQTQIFYSVLCGLGALGIILEVTIQCSPKFYLHQLTYPSTLDSILDRLDDKVTMCDHFRFLWFPHTDYVSVSITNRINGPFLSASSFDFINGRRSALERLNRTNDDDQGGFFNSTIEEIDSSGSNASSDEFEKLWPEEALYSLPTVPFVLSSEKSFLQKVIDWAVNYGIGYHFLQLLYWFSTYVPSFVPSINRIAFWLLYSSTSVQLDISYKIFNFECLFDQYVNEWCIPRNKTATVLRELKEVIESPHAKFYAHFPVEVRFCRSSEIYLAPTHARDSTYINIICYRPYRKFVPHQEYWDRYEEIMKKAGGRPHWAKAHRETAADFVRMYPYFRLWTQVRRRLDPHNLFSNSYMDRMFSTGTARKLFDFTAVADQKNDSSLVILDSSEL